MHWDDYSCFIAGWTIMAVAVSLQNGLSRLPLCNDRTGYYDCSYAIAGRAVMTAEVTLQELPWVQLHYCRMIYHNCNCVNAVLEHIKLYFLIVACNWKIGHFFIFQPWLGKHIWVEQFHRQKLSGFWCVFVGRQLWKRNRNGCECSYKQAANYCSALSLLFHETFR